LAGLHLGHEALLGFEAAAGAHGLEHFAHLGVLAEEVVDLLDGGSEPRAMAANLEPQSLQSEWRIAVAFTAIRAAPIEIELKLEAR
jgi:hypothetical protein